MSLDSYNDRKIGKYLLRGGGTCPEQYDVYLAGREVGYLRLRNGKFRAEVPFGGKVVYEAEPQGDGCFEEEEREKYLNEAIQAIDLALGKKQPIEIRLKKALAEMLPEIIGQPYPGKSILRWKRADSVLYDAEVLDTELLHLCWLVEENLTDKEIDQYLFILDYVVELSAFEKRISSFRYHADWMARTWALSKLKKINVEG